MDESARFIAGFALVRAVHFGACLLMLCVCVFDRTIVVVVGEPARSDWHPIARRFFLTAAPAALASGAAWLAMVAIQMSGLPPAQAWRGEVISTVWNQTQFGHLWGMRLIFWLAEIASFVGFLKTQSRRKIIETKMAASIAIWSAMLFGALLCGSLAWAGHGQTGRAVRWHLTADVAHLLICAVWPIGLLPFFMLLWRLGRDCAESPGERSKNIGRLTRRFSAISFLSVLLLTGTGLVNSWILVGSISSLFSSLYGKTLLVKVALFGAMTVIGAINLLRWKPRLMAAASEPDNDAQQSAVRWLRINVATELILSIVIFLIVGVLGLRSPAAEHMRVYRQPSDDAATLIDQ